MSVRTMGRTAAVLATAIFVAPCAILFPHAASALDQPTTPQPVADYFAEGLIPRLIDLYGAGDGVTKGVDFDATTRVGAITRVREWTPDFLAGKTVEDPTRLTNDWVAPVAVRGDVLGLATVWISPVDNEPELATFDSADFARRIAAAPKDSWLVHDPARDAWFALTEDGLIPLVAGTSGVADPLTVAAYQRLIMDAPPDLAEKAASGVPIAALVLGIVVLFVAIFVILPVGRKEISGSADEEDNDDDRDDDEEDDEDGELPIVKAPVKPTAAAPTARK